MQRNATEVWRQQGRRRSRPLQTTQPPFRPIIHHQNPRCLHCQWVQMPATHPGEYVGSFKGFELFFSYVSRHTSPEFEVVFPYAMSVISQRHDVSGNPMEILNILDELVQLSLEKGYRAPRTLLNMSVKRGRREHLHGWVIFDNPADKLLFDRLHATVGGVRPEFSHIRQRILVDRPYETDVVVEKEAVQLTDFSFAQSFYVFSFWREDGFRRLIARPPTISS